MKLQWKSCFKIGVSIFALYLCIHYWKNVAGLISSMISAAFPLFVGCCVAYILNILMDFYERLYFPKSEKKFIKKSRRAVCITASFVTLIGIVALVAEIVYPQLASCVRLIIKAVPSAAQTVLAFLEKRDVLPNNVVDIINSIDLNSKITEIVDVLKSGVGNVVNVAFKTLTSLFSGIVSMLLGVIFAVYLLSSKEKLCSQCKRMMKNYLHEKWHGKILYVLGVFNDCFRKYIVGQCVEAVILSLLCLLGMLILNLPYAPMISVLMGFTALIPIAGAYIGAGVGAFMIVMVSPIKALVFLIFIVLLQQIEGNVIYPKVVGNSLGLPGIWVLAAVTVGGGIMGIIGMLFSVPTVAAIYRLVQNDIHKREEKALSEKNVETETKEEING